MDKNSIFGRPLNSIDFFNNLASVFGIKVGNENLLKIPARTGSGIIRKVEVALGIDLFFFDFYLKHKIDLKRIMLMNAEEKMFSAICILTPNSLFVSKGEQVNENAWRDIPAILFTSIANEFAFMILPDLRVKAVIINFRLDYLQKECNNSNYNVYKDFKNFFLSKATGEL